MSDENAAQLPQVITSEVGSSPETVTAVRNEIPVGVAGTPIDRIPYQAGLAAMVNAGTYTKRIASTDRCIRVIDIPLKGGQVIQCHCSRACVSVGDMRLCPDHDKAAFQPNQTPHGTVGRTLNADLIPLTKAEKDDLVKTSKSYAEHGDTPLPTIQRAEKMPDAARYIPVKDGYGPEPKHDIKIYLTLDELAGRELLDVLRDRIVAALDGLPCGSVRQMKQIVALQEAVTKIGSKPRRREKHVRHAPTDPS